MYKNYKTRVVAEMLPLFLIGGILMAILCGWASIGSNGSITGDTSGDNNGKEVKLGDWYQFKQNAVYRFKDRELANRFANQIVKGCQNDCIGYNQAKRTTFYQQLVKTNYDITKITTNCDCDCSSFVGACLVSIGVDIPHNITTATLDSNIMKTGLFEKLTADKYLTSYKYLKTGDIINRPYSHVITVVEGYTSPELSYIKGNRFLTLDEMTTNAKYIYKYLRQRGWSSESISGMLGNMQTESSINSGIWQSLNEGNLDGGFGLVQWTPCRNFFEWCDSNNLERDSMDTQLQRIIYELENGVQYYPTSEYPLTFKQFRVSRETPEYLASSFLMNYERPKTPNHEERRKQARYWYDRIMNEDWDSGTETPEPPVVEPPTPEEKPNNIYDRLLTTSYNMNKLDSNTITFLKSIQIGSIVKIKFTFDRNKRRIGHNAFGGKLTRQDLSYTIVDVRENGLLQLAHEETCLFQYVYPNQLHHKSGALKVASYDIKDLTATSYDEKQITAYEYESQSTLIL